MYDEFDTIGASKIQHGKSNNRVYLMKLAREDYPGIVDSLQQLGREKGYEKIFAKIPAWAEEGFVNAGYMREGYIPGFYSGTEDAAFMGLFLDPARAERTAENVRFIEETIALAKGKAQAPGHTAAPDGFVLRKLTTADATALTEVYKVVFATYPFPIYEPEYIRETIENDLIEYFGAFAGDTLVAAASAEMDSAAANVEMTDFATLPEYLGNRLAVHLLELMEDRMAERDMKMFYTIARAVSPGMNITFARRGYAFGGTLVNNTNISGEIESMNLWYRRP